MENEFILKPERKVNNRVKRGIRKYKYDDYTSIKFYFIGPLVDIWRFKKDRMYSIEIRWHHNGL